ncbi:type II secretion system protein [Variovorax sp. WDL1]|nr:type II secretion system protein [Variovorax sp. WDL1]
MVLNGMVHAASKPLAYARLKRAGFKPLRVTLNAGGTIKGVFSKEFDTQELARFYITLGRRIQNGKSLGDGLESAIDYVSDPRLRQAVMIMRQAMIDGQSEHQAMLAAGFPRRDCLSIKSTAEAGKAATSFISLGEEIQRTDAIRRSVSSTFRIPKVMAVFMVLFIWAAIVFMAPMTLTFLKQTGLRLSFSPFIANYFEFVKLFNGGLPRHTTTTVISSCLYFGAFAGIAYFLRSQTFKDMLDRIESLRTLSVKSDHAALWNSFVLLYDAAIPAKEAAVIVGDSAKRLDSKRAFHKMGKLIDAGRPLDDAVTNAGFPPVVMNGIKAAVSSGSIVQGMTEMAKNLEEDVRVMTDLLQENVKLLSVLFVGLGLLLVFVMTYYPMMASVMSNL